MENFRGEQRTLEAHRILMRAGLSLVSTFAWVFVFGYAFWYSDNVQTSFLVALLVYGVSQAVLAVTTPFSASHLRNGIKRSLISGACLAALSFAILGATYAGYFSSPIGWGLVLFGIILGAYRSLYWIPYRLQESRSNSTQYVLFEILIALMPAFAGVTLVTVSLSTLRLLFGAAVLILISIIPVFFLRDFGENFEWGYAETFWKLFDSRYRSLSSRAALAGVESAALFLVWPLSVFLLVNGSYLIFGFVMSASLLVLLVGRDIYKWLMRMGFPKGSMPLDVAFSVSGWALRLVAGSPVGIVFADSYSYVSAPSDAPDFFSREHPSDSGSYLDEYTALQEIAMAVGRIAMCVFTAVLITFLPMALALAGSLIIAAFAAGVSTALSYRTRIEPY